LHQAVSRLKNHYFFPSVDKTASVTPFGSNKALATSSGSLLFQASSAYCTFCKTVSKLKGGSGNRCSVRAVFKVYNVLFHCKDAKN